MVVGITGGIGAGKSTVAEILVKMGYSVFNADKEAKLLYALPEVREQMCAKFGSGIYDEEAINRSKLAEIIFNDSSALAFVNQLIHPLVAQRFIFWKAENDQQVCFLESALLLEENSKMSFDKLWFVNATESNRIERVQKRDNAIIKDIKARMEGQKGVKKGLEIADFVIENNGELLIPQVMKVLAKVSSTKNL